MCERNEAIAELGDRLDRNHSWRKCAFIACGLSLCITVDILQYSMPLAFLPSVLEDRGHEQMQIATAIGIYYWTGFFGCFVITCYQVWCLLYPRSAQPEEEVASLKTTQRQITYLIVGLLLGSVTLVGQALYPHMAMHIACRFIQGLAGAFIFFYTFLLSVSMFEGPQQVFAMTAASTALNLAEVLGSSLGAVLFNAWGQRVVFWVLGVVSVLNQIFLVTILCIIGAAPALARNSSSPGQPELVPEAPRRRGSLRAMLEEPVGTDGSPQSGSARLWAMLRCQRLGCAVVLIVMAAIVKGSVEEILPFHADHRWGFNPMKIGQLFSIIAVAYICAAVATGHMWHKLKRYRIVFSAFWLAILGGTAWAVLMTASFYKREPVLWLWLAIYGISLGLTHTPAALLLADAIGHQEGRAKDAANGIWNTMWEAGGSLGFLLGGLLAENYHDQINLMTGYIVFCVLSAGAMLFIAHWPLGLLSSGGSASSHLKALTAEKDKDKEATYGSML
jgi:MFS family permease